MRAVRYVGSKVKTSFAIVGAAAALGVYYEYNRVFPSTSASEDAAGEKKKVLVIPFHRIQLKDKHEREFSSSLSRFSRDSDDRIIQLEVKELVDIIHHAASNPNIAALYGVFGHGSVLSSAGWADVEEVRNALKVFREVHRVHSEPNLDHDLQRVIKRTEVKPLYAYADTFSSLTDPGNKEYYLASIFTHIHMQRNGELNLFGMLSQQLFLRDMLQKYGVKLHVFKHGEYKNFPNMFTDSKFNKAHLENVTNILKTINADVCDDISGSRSKTLMASWLKKRGGDGLWKRIHESGTFPALTAWKAGLVDFLPRRDPLPELVESNKKKKRKDELKLEWQAKETDFDRFKAEEIITLTTYAQKVKNEKTAKERRRKWHSLLNDTGAISSALTKLGLAQQSEDGNDTGKKDNIALLYVQGGIDDAMARKTVNAIRKIRKDKDTKCVVVRVSSPGGSIFSCETIAAELKGLNVPVVFSFGNVAASGGYYIASGANRIFASPKTVTGSIGVFGVRADLTGLAASYGVKAQHVTAGNLSGSLAPLHPMSNKMKENFATCIDRYYDQFKGVVSEGRGMAADDVESVAQGRVWTGDQAKLNGLVDEIGGLHRALAFARRNYAKADADIVVWPKKRSFLEMAAEARQEGDIAALLRVVFEGISNLQWMNEGPDTVSKEGDLESMVAHLMKASSNGNPGMLSGVFLAADENTALRCLVDSAAQENDNNYAGSYPVSFWD